MRTPTTFTKNNFVLLAQVFESWHSLGKAYNLEEHVIGQFGGDLGVFLPSVDVHPGGVEDLVVLPLVSHHRLLAEHFLLQTTHFL